MMFRSQSLQIVHETLCQNNPSQKKMSGGDGQGVGPEFLPQYQKKKKLTQKGLAKWHK
jgi:hypothetical protein